MLRGLGGVKIAVEGHFSDKKVHSPSLVRFLYHRTFPLLSVLCCCLISKGCYKGTLSVGCGLSCAVIGTPLVCVGRSVPSLCSALAPTLFDASLSPSCTSCKELVLSIFSDFHYWSNRFLKVCKSAVSPD